jgi:hypothetical protein
MCSLDEVIDVIEATIISNEDSTSISSGYSQKIVLKLSWKREYLEVLNSYSRDE